MYFKHCFLSFFFHSLFYQNLFQVYFRFSQQLKNYLHDELNISNQDVISLHELYDEFKHLQNIHQEHHEKIIIQSYLRFFIILSLFQLRQLIQSIIFIFQLFRLVQLKFQHCFPLIWLIFQQLVIIYVLQFKLSQQLFFLHTFPFILHELIIFLNIFRIKPQLQHQLQHHQIN